MSGKDETAVDSFDAWMGGRPSVMADGEAEQPAPDNDEHGEDAGALKSRAAKLKSPAVLIPSLIGVVVVVLMLFRGQGEPEPTEGQYAAIPTVAAESVAAPLPDAGTAPPPPQAAVADVEAEGAAEAPVAYEQLAQSADEAPLPAPAAPETTQGTEAPAEAEQAAKDTDSGPSRRELELRIEALENDLDRAQQTRHANLRTIRSLRAQLAQLEGQGSFSVVAVLNDGVVVRDKGGSERVYGVGSRIGE